MIQHKWKGLQRHDDDWHSFEQRGAEGAGFAGPFAGDLDNNARFMLKLVDGFTQLLIEHGAVGDDDHRVEYFFIGHGVQAGKPMRQPRQRV